MKILDFGLAKAASDPTVRMPGLRVLLPEYAAPEQIDRQLGEPGPWTDVYSLALIVMEALLGAPVFASKEGAPAAQIDPVLQALGAHRRSWLEARGSRLAWTRSGPRAEKAPRAAGELWAALKSAASPAPTPSPARELTKGPRPTSALSAPATRPPNPEAETIPRLPRSSSRKTMVGLGDEIAIVAEAHAQDDNLSPPPLPVTPTLRFPFSRGPSQHRRSRQSLLCLPRPPSRPRSYPLSLPRFLRPFPKQLPRRPSLRPLRARRCLCFQRGSNCAPRRALGRDLVRSARRACDAHRLRRGRRATSHAGAPKRDVRDDRHCHPHSGDAIRAYRLRSAAAPAATATAATSTPSTSSAPSSTRRRILATAKRLVGAAAYAALGAIGTNLESCQRPGGRSGAGAAWVTFGRDGSVTHIKIGPPFAGTPQGKCLTDLFRAARVGPSSVRPAP